MKRLIGVALCLLFILGCADKKTTARLDELQAKNDQLTQRVKSLEDQLLEADKKLIAHQQALQQINERTRNLENDFDKLRYGQSVPR